MAHLHTGADYDASGNMTARAPSESASQQQLTWDNEGRLTSWQNAPSSPTSTAHYLYDGEGNRVEQQATTGRDDSYDDESSLADGGSWLASGR